MPELSDADLHALLIEDPDRGWRAFVDRCTPTLVALIERTGVDRDAVTDVYVRVCERLSENDCARLRRYDPNAGALAAWLTVVVRHVAVDWVRSRAGRRRMFACVRELGAFDRRVFELYYWEGWRPSEIAGLLESERRRPTSLVEVFDAMERIHSVLTDRHRSQLMAHVARSRVAASLDTGEVPQTATRATGPGPEGELRVRDVDRRFSDALRALPTEDAAALRLLFVQGWSHSEVQRALGLQDFGPAEVRAILDALKAALARMGLGRQDAATPGLTFLEDERL